MLSLSRETCVCAAGAAHFFSLEKNKSSRFGVPHAQVHSSALSARQRVAASVALRTQASQSAGAPMLFALYSWLQQSLGELLAADAAATAAAAAAARSATAS